MSPPPDYLGLPTIERHDMAAHESAKTTKLSDRTHDTIALDEVERIAF
jgi:hypothetical protein